MDIALQEDLEIIAGSTLPFDKINNTTILITGATGLIGVSLVRSLLKIKEKNNLKIRILALIRNEQKAHKIYGNLLNDSELVFFVGDITKSIILPEQVDYIFHCASVTASKTMIDYPVETLTTSVIGTKNLLDIAVKQSVKSFVYVSSMEVYGTFEASECEITENLLGFIDLMNVRSNYPESKRLCENMCIAYLQEYHVPVKIARLAQTFGAGVLPDENRVFVQFARSVMNQKNIILHTKGLSEGNYCYLRDAILGLFTILLKGQDGEAYNVSNPETHTTIAAMAQMVCEKIAKNRITVEFDIPVTNTFGYAVDTKMKLNSDKLQQLGWKPEVGLEESYIRLIRSLSSQKDSEMICNK